MTDMENDVREVVFTTTQHNLARQKAEQDLVRAREDAVRECRNARHRLKALLLRNGITYAGKTAWTAAHLRWLATLRMAHATQQIGLQEYLHAITEATARIARLEQALRDALPEWTLKPLVQALQALYTAPDAEAPHAA